MKFSKAISIAAVAACLLSQAPANAGGNAHKYPVTVPTAPASAKANDVVTTKPSAPATTAPNEAVASKPSDPVSTLSVEKITLPFIMVSRYEPLSSRDSLEAVPDLNRGHGGGK